MKYISSYNLPKTLVRCYAFRDRSDSLIYIFKFGRIYEENLYIYLSTYETFGCNRDSAELNEHKQTEPL